HGPHRQGHHLHRVVGDHRREHEGAAVGEVEDADRSPRHAHAEREQQVQRSEGDRVNQDFHSGPLLSIVSCHTRVSCLFIVFPDSWLGTSSRGPDQSSPSVTTTSSEPFQLAITPSTRTSLFSKRRGPCAPSKPSAATLAMPSRIATRSALLASLMPRASSHTAS